MLTVLLCSHLSAIIVPEHNIKPGPGRLADNVMSPPLTANKLESHKNETCETEKLLTSQQVSKQTSLHYI